MSNSPRYKNFESFFKKATTYEPYPYQIKLAKSQIPSVINVPTGAGKTEAAILSLWMWRRELKDENTPTRLIYCLPMRVLVEQTVQRINNWIKNLGLEDTIGVISLMGGSENEEFQKYPGKEYIIIGTQDMLISGALNRAYGNSPQAWPVFFGLFNNDCMWIMDEIQIMENAFPTSLQLDVFRKQFETYGLSKTVWMSATINKDWLKTINFNGINDSEICSLSKEDKEHEKLKVRNKAAKTIHRADIKFEKYDRNVVKYLHGLHKKGTTTAIIVNTVKRAQELYDLIKKEGCECKLIHSRFREKDRSKLNEWINALDQHKDKIIISTQVLEAGVDISVRTMITEIAPWANMVQRFGRCNRTGKLDQADIYWIELPNKLFTPYEEKDMELAKEKLKELDNKSASPIDLPHITEQKNFDVILRKRDLVDLFDNASDISGNRVDASRFVRTIKQQLNVVVFWRDDLINDPQKQNKHERKEICSVPIYDLKEFLKKAKEPAYSWNNVEGKLERVKTDKIFPGQVVMVDSKNGGYSETYGWKKEIKEKVETYQPSDKRNDSNGYDAQSESKYPVTLEDHTKHVLEELKAILDKLKIVDDDIKGIMTTTAKYHDIGKMHNVFQETLREGITDKDIDKNQIWAKSQKMSKHSIPGFRHEVVSALVYLKQPDIIQDKKLQNLVAYLIVSHHGKVRLSLRDVIKKKYDTEDRKYLLGINVNGDTIPEFSSSVVSVKETKIDVSLAKIGQNNTSKPSWVERVLSLRDEYGPFRLGYLESLIRAADTLASQKEGKNRYE